MLRKKRKETLTLTEAIIFSNRLFRKDVQIRTFQMHSENSSLHFDIFKAVIDVSFPGHVPLKKK